MSLPEESFLSHLVELRDRLIRAMLSILIVFLCLFPWAKDLYALLAQPLLAMPQPMLALVQKKTPPVACPIPLVSALPPPATTASASSRYLPYGYINARSQDRAFLIAQG